MAMDYDKEIDNILDDLDTLHETKVDAVNGKQLSTNDFTNEHLRKVNRIETEEYQQEIVSGVTKELERTNDNHVRLADEFHRHLYGQDGVDAKFRKEIQDNLNYMSGLVKSANDRMNEIWQNWDEIVKEDQNHELRLQQVEGKTLTHDALIDSNTSEILNIQGEQVIQNNQIKEMQDKNVELKTRVVDVEVSDADQNHRLDIAENRIGTFTDRMTALEDGYAQRDARMDGLDAQVSRYTERMLAIELNEKAQDERIKAEVEKNKRQDIDIACLYAEAKDRTINIDTEGTAVELQNSREGFVVTNSIEGNTMVNCNKDVDKEMALLTSTVDVSSDNNVTLTEGVVDGGKVDVYLEGNTLVNVSKTKDVTPITHESEDTTGNHIALAEEGSIRPVLNGNTLVNVCDQKDPVAITKSYTVETGNHVALQGEYNGKCRPVVTGNTLVNLLDSNDFTFYSFYCKWDGFKLNVNYDAMPDAGNIDFMEYKGNRLVEGNTYTVIINLSGTYSEGTYGGNTFGKALSGLNQGINKIVFTYSSSMDICRCWVGGNSETIDYALEYLLLLEGDYTNKPIPGYFEGLQSSFEDKVVTQEMVDAGEELAENLGKYKVDYVVTGKNKFDKSKALDNYGIMDASTGSVSPASNWFAATIKGEPNTSYKIRGKIDGTSVVFLDSNKSVISYSTDGANGSFTTPSNCQYIIVNGLLTQKDTFQLEEGTTETTYEPYKEYKKTFYLNSPLLEGDTIEQQGNNVVHVHRYGKVVLDGSSDEIYESQDNSNDSKRYQFNIPNQFHAGTNYQPDNRMICDKYPIKNFDTSGTSNNFISAWGYADESADTFAIFNSCTTIDELRQYLSNNPTTVIYQLATPQYEVISTNDTILCDSYVNGHLDVDSVVPIKRVDFLPFEEELAYLYPSTQYAVQFVSDAVSKVDITLGGAKLLNQDVVVGTNKYMITTPSTLVNNKLVLNGENFNASNIVVTEATDQDFGYFSGMQSCFEDNLVTEGENAGKYRVDYKVTGKNKVNSEIKDMGHPSGRYVCSNRYSNFDSVIPLKQGIYQLSLQTGFKPGNFVDSSIYIWSKNGTKRGAKSYDPFEIKYNEVGITWYGAVREGMGISDLIGTYIQIEEGTTSTTYEPYKEYTKTLYLNSPLLEGDTIEEKDGNIYHVHKYGKVVLDGSEDEAWGKYVQYTLSDGSTDENLTTYCTSKYVTDDNGWNTTTSYCDKLKSFKDMQYAYWRKCECVSVGNSQVLLSCYKSELSDFKLWLQSNPVTLVYQLKTPQYELIQQQGTIAMPTYSAGHLDVTTAVPLDKVNFLHFEEELTYLYPSTSYTVQFVSDNAITVDITLGGKKLMAQSVIKGLNKITITTPETLTDNKLIIDGVGANISEVVVTESIDQDFGYFEGMKSVGECEDLEVVSSNSDSTLSNTQTLTHEPLRAVGDIKDKYVLIDGKWYIERNCGVRAYQEGDIDNYITDMINTVYPLSTPTYEPIDYNPFEVYNEVTHISANSTIPCNVTVKNHGYNCILKPSTTYTVVSNQGVQNMTTPATLGDSLRFSGNGLLKDVMILEGTLSDNQIPGNFAGMESSFEQHKITDEHDEHFGYYEVNVTVRNEDGTKESNIKFYIKDPLRGIGDVKDKVFVEDGKVKILRNCGQREYVEGDFELYTTDKVNTVYPLAEPTYEEAVYSGIRLSQNIWEKSTLFFDTNIPSTANISYSISTPVLDQVAEVSSITDDQDALIIDMATQLAVLTLTM